MDFSNFQRFDSISKIKMGANRLFFRLIFFSTEDFFIKTDKIRLQSSDLFDDDSPAPPLGCGQGIRRVS